MIIKRFDDTQYKHSEITTIRHTVRLFVRDEQGLFWFLVIRGEDDFGKRHHYETIGGGMEAGEQFIDTIKRELKEEIGYEVREWKEIGTIIDRYYLIHRETHSHFYLVTIDSNKAQERHLTDLEKTLFAGIVKFKKEEVCGMLSCNEDSSKVDFLVQRRDLYAFEYALEKGLLNE